MVRLEKIAYNPYVNAEIHDRLQDLSARAEQHAAFIKEQALQENRKRSVLKNVAKRRLAHQEKELAVAIEKLSTLKEQEAKALAIKNETQHQLSRFWKKKNCLFIRKELSRPKLRR